MRIAALLVALAISAAPAHACYSVKFKNQSDSAVSVAWKAGGCLKVWQFFAVVCTHHKIEAGESRSYNYNWGTTAPMIVVLLPGKDGRKYSSGYASYNLHGKHFGRSRSSDAIPASVPKCNKHYTITYTQEDFDKDYATLE